MLNVGRHERTKDEQQQFITRGLARSHYPECLVCLCQNYCFEVPNLAATVSIDELIK